MSRFEGKIGGKGGDPVDAAEILAALASDDAREGELRREAISRYFSASDGWREASALLCGAFVARKWLKPGKGK